MVIYQGDIDNLILFNYNYNHFHYLTLVTRKNGLEF